MMIFIVVISFLASLFSVEEPFQGEITYEEYTQDFKPTGRIKMYRVKNGKVKQIIEHSNYNGAITDYISGITFSKDNRRNVYMKMSRSSIAPILTPINRLDSTSNIRFQFEQKSTELMGQVPMSFIKRCSVDSTNKMNSKLRIYNGATFCIQNALVIAYQMITSSSSLIHETNYLVLKSITEKQIDNSEFDLDPDFEIEDVKSKN